MASYNRNGWLDTVLDQVRCKPERKAIRAELQGHLEDKEQQLLDAGMDPAQAGRTAVAAMGDPVEVGKALDKAHPSVWGHLYTAAKVVIVLLCIVIFFIALDGIIGDDWKGWTDHYPLRVVATDPSNIEDAVILEDIYEPIKQSGYTIDVTQVYWKPTEVFYGASGTQTIEDVLEIDIKVSNPRPWAAAPLFISLLQVQGDEDTALNEIYSRMEDGGWGRGTMDGWYSILSELRYWDAWYFTVELTGVELGEEVTLYLPGNEDVKWTFRVEVRS
ncbi:MAG: permease prefix domain 1-containing protein [Oscillospiraceae bacterium]